MNVSAMHNTVRGYAWGSTDLLATMRGAEPSGDKEAEVWMGAHPGAPSVLVRSGGSTPLDRAITDDPVGTLGASLASRYGRLPFLLKLLAAAEPLSLQAHPSLERARAGFERENRAGIAIDAAHRSYKDNNHKPELICALTQFRALVGFRPTEETLALFESLEVAALDPVMSVLRAQPSASDLSDLLRWILTLDENTGAALAHDVGAAVQAHGRWEAERSVARAISRVHPGDPGVITALMLNTVVLEPGQAVHLGAGVLHAYVDGLGVEIMASSDNVLRGGLTPKHVDIDELCCVVDAAPGEVEVLVGTETDGEFVYQTSSVEFELRRIELTGETARQAAGPEILVATAGSVSVDGRRLDPGSSVFVPAGVRWSAIGHGQLFRALVPQ
ncbi:MAG: mannose-6-phosphate isomerase, class I [Actinomycetia bacterium]|nr:mannose-6-phosphate isomerase, class I [Actinomycetes bacterium]MCP4961373.1 mannose-6-phosphate isomerase, class I [Actinomycetes bacterium]